MKNSIQLVGVSIIALSMVYSGSASSSDNVTELETRKLPEYCRYQQFFCTNYKGGCKTPEYSIKHDMWEAKLGHCYLHMHHWCTGLVQIDRYYLDFKGSDATRRGYLSEAIGNISYVIGNSDKSCESLPKTLRQDMLVSRGKAYGLRHETDKAAADFTRAIVINPKYADPYLYFADLYMQMGLPDRAKEIIAKGLAENPQSKSLAKYAQKLNAK